MVNKEAFKSILLFITCLWFTSGMTLTILSGLSMLIAGKCDTSNSILFGFGIICTIAALWLLYNQWEGRNDR
jgi:hypothetical protein